MKFGRIEKMMLFPAVYGEPEPEEPSKYRPNARVLHDPKTGITYPSIAAAAKAKGWPDGTLRSRLKTMSVEEALNTPVKRIESTRGNNRR